jgi:acetoin utilization deacetylase AcuC-like enzyme
MVRRDKQVAIFYRPEMVAKDAKQNFSKSPTKPKLFVESLKRKFEDFDERFILNGNFEPFTNEDFLLAHSKEYVDEFFAGIYPLCESNGLSWSRQFAESVRYTNSSLYNAIKHSIKNPGQICCSPTSGFHHATFKTGMGFCTFSGQVIASLKIYEEFGLSGCYFDLDGHFGNSIESYRRMKGFKSKDALNNAIPIVCNVNPSGKGVNYIKDLKYKFKLIKDLLISDKIQYVVWCHGADSHIRDPLGDQCDTDQWLLCTSLFTNFIKEVEEVTKRPTSITTALFGGYQKNYENTIKLHVEDMNIIINKLI